MKKSLFAAIAALAAASATASTAAITAVGIVQKSSREVVVTYRLTGADAIVTMDVTTNGVSIGEDKLSNAAGDVNRLVAASDSATRTISWRPDRTWPNVEINDGSLKAVLTAWAPNTPPQYMAVNLDLPDAVFYYTSSNAVPGGVMDARYRETWMLFRRIEAAGKMWRMGPAPDESGEGAVDIANDTRIVTLTQDFYAGVFAVTRRQYKTVMGAYRGSQPAVCAGNNSDWAPVSAISYVQLRGAPDDTPSVDWPATGRETVSEGSIIKAFRTRTGLAALDLPTEAQWEFAARGGVTTGYPGGAYEGGDATKLARGGDWGWFKLNCGDNKGVYAQGQKLPNGYGLYDILGNAMEACLNWMGSETDMICVDPVGPDSGTTRSQRGTYVGWPGNAYTFRIPYRRSVAPTSAASEQGFRLFLTLD